MTKCHPRQIRLTMSRVTIWSTSLTSPSRVKWTQPTCWYTFSHSAHRSKHRQHCSNSKVSWQKILAWTGMRPWSPTSTIYTVKRRRSSKIIQSILEALRASWTRRHVISSFFTSGQAVSMMAITTNQLTSSAKATKRSFKFERARSEAITSFGNGDIFIERFVDHPRHIEVQVMGDKAGNMVHLYER